MPFLDHLEELRWRVLYSLLAVVVGTLLGWVIVEHVDVIGLLIEPIKPLIPGGKLRVTSPTDPFFITLQFAFVMGLVLASPIVGYQIWAFLAPALYARERRLIVPALSVGALLFLGGAAAAFRWLLPRALTLLLSFQAGVFDPLITACADFGFAAKLIIAVGLFTELPLVIVILAALGLVTPPFLARNRRYAPAVSAMAAALLAPPDAVSMLGGMVLLVALYEVSIWCAWVVTKRRARRARREGDEGGGGGGRGGGGRGGGGGGGGGRGRGRGSGDGDPRRARAPRPRGRREWARGPDPAHPARAPGPDPAAPAPGGAGGGHRPHGRGLRRPGPHPRHRYRPPAGPAHRPDPLLPRPRSRHRFAQDAQGLPHDAVRRRHPHRPGR